MNTVFLKIPVLIILATLGFATDDWLTSAERPQVMSKRKAAPRPC